MLRLISFIFIISSLSFCFSQNEHRIFAQAIFSIPNSIEMLEIEADIRQHPNVMMVRLDFHTQRALIFTKNISELSESDFRSWFGKYDATLKCIQIGVSGVDKLNSLSSENNCN